MREQQPFKYLSIGVVNDRSPPRHIHGAIACEPAGWWGSHPEQEVKEPNKSFLQPALMKSKAGRLIFQRSPKLTRRASFDTTAKHKGSVCFSNQKGKTRWEVDRTPPEHSKRGKDSRGLSDSVRHWHFLWALLLLLVPRMEPISWTSVFLTRWRVRWWYKMSRRFPAFFKARSFVYIPMYTMET